MLCNNLCDKTSLHTLLIGRMSETLVVSQKLHDIVYISLFINISSLQCYSVLSDTLVKNELCIPLERGSNVLSTGVGFISLFPPVSLKSLCFSVLSTKRQFPSVL